MLKKIFLTGINVNQFAATCCCNNDKRSVLRKEGGMRLPETPAPTIFSAMSMLKRACSLFYAAVYPDETGLLL
ncbi:MAG: hypothetical protein QM687_10250 [Ferruginibacter sp.]